MKYRATRNVSVALLLVSAACSPEKVTGVLEVGDLVVSVREVHYGDSPTEPIVRLRLATERTYPSISDYIDAATDVDGRTITVLARRIVEPPIAVGAIGPATYKVTIPSAEGEYALRVLRRGVADEYRIAVTTTAIELRPVRTRFTRASPSRAWRYPERSLVVGCTITAYLSTGSLERCNELRDSLIAAASLERIEFGPEGEIPYFTGTSLPGHEERAEHYRYASEEDFARVGAVIRSYAQRYPRANAWAQNWRNEWHRSWLP